MALEHDVRGNIVGVVDTSPENVRLMQTYKIDKHNRVSRIDMPGPTTLLASYDRYGRLRNVDINGEVVNYTHNDAGQLTLIETQTTIWYPQNQSKRGIFIESEADVRGLLLNDEFSLSQPEYGFVRFSTGNMDLHFRNLEEFLIDEVDVLTQETKSIHALLGQGKNEDFEKPSNAVFHPLEYASTNCCVGCPFNSPCGQFCTTYFGTSEFTCNCSSATYCSSGSSKCGNAQPVTCSPKSDDSKSKARETLVNELVSLPSVNYEFGRRVDCPDPKSVDLYVDASNSMENCVYIGTTSDAIYAGHTHALYSIRDIEKFQICCSATPEEGCIYLYSPEQVRALNRKKLKMF